jgi:hypothetical protein
MTGLTLFAPLSIHLGGCAAVSGLDNIVGLESNGDSVFVGS